jgi:hypothetical protein
LHGFAHVFTGTCVLVPDERPLARRVLGRTGDGCRRSCRESELSWVKAGSAA